MTTNSPPRILQIGRLPLPALETELAARYSVACLADQADPSGFLAAHGAEFSGVVTTASIGLQGEVIAALPNLKVISSFGVGFDALDIGTASARGVHALAPFIVHFAPHSRVSSQGGGARPLRRLQCRQATCLGRI